jgi:protein-S-isoprenylcysteine O-methyltransferase Ste14
MSDQIIVGTVAVLWCTMHSIMIMPGVEDFGRKALGNFSGWYRFIYVTFSCLTLGIAYMVIKQFPGEHLYSLFPSSRVLMVSLSAVITWMAVRQYDNRFFLGITQITNPDKEPTFNRAGILNYMRHPYYVAGIIFVIFYNNFTTTSIVWRSVFVLYFIIGAKIEEKKLLAEHGQSYRDYMNDVPAFGRRWRLK